MPDIELKVETKAFRIISLKERRERVEDAHKRRSEISSSHINLQVDEKYKHLRKYIPRNSS